MKKPSLLLSVCILLFVVSACSSVKRYNSAEWKGQDNSLVDMELFGARLEQTYSETAGKNLWDLSASAQAGLIQILNERYPNNEQFIGALSAAYLTEGATPMLDLTNMNLRMVFTISKHRDYRLLNQTSARFSPADRIEYLKFNLELPREYKLSFKDWNRFTTEYGEIEIADVSFSTSLDLEAEGQVKQNDVGGKTSFSRTEQQEVRSRYLKLNGSISDLIIAIEEEGTREIDLTGNVIADVSLEFEGFPERIVIPVFSGEKNLGAGNYALSAFRFFDVLVPRMEEVVDTIRATLTLEYVYRHVQSGSQTFAEWDDQVEYYTGVVKKQVPLFNKSDYLPDFYCISDESHGSDLLKFRRGGDREYLLQFISYEDAYKVMECLENLQDQGGALKNEPVIFGNSILHFKGKPVTIAEASEVSWRVQAVY